MTAPGIEYLDNQNKLGYSVDMGKTHISAHIYVATTLLGTIGAFGAFYQWGYHDQLFFLPIFLVALFWSVILFLRQQEGLSAFYVEHNDSWWRLLRRAIPRYLIWLSIIGFGWVLYTTHMHYRGYTKSNEFFLLLLGIVLVGGIPYFIVTLRYKASRIEDFYDPAIRILHIIKQLLLSLLHRRYRGRARRVLRNRGNQKVLLNLIMRAYFLPVMVSQVYSGFSNSISYANSGGWSSLLGFMTWLAAMLWLADALCASVGYCLESRWTESRSRSIDMTSGGWLICLCCYAPLNDVTGTLFPFAPSVVTGQTTHMLFQSELFLITLKSVETFILAALVYSDLSLGPSGVNITLKKVQSSGPYGIVRHPATVCKLSFWWIQSIFYVGFWQWHLILGQLMWNVIYVLRALTEERHLKQYPEYREYMAKVRYRFIPRVI